MLEINEKVEKNKWNEFIINNKGSFLQSFEWGEFQNVLGERTAFGTYLPLCVIGEDNND